jgi:hypothetical protein
MSDNTTDGSLHHFEVLRNEKARNDLKHLQMRGEIQLNHSERTCRPINRSLSHRTEIDVSADLSPSCLILHVTASSAHSLEKGTSVSQ